LRYLDEESTLRLYRRIIDRAGGTAGVRDPADLQSAIARPRMTFDGADLYPTPADKAAALAFSLVKNHAVVDGNKRIGFAAAGAFLRLNGHRIVGDVDEMEAVILRLAAGEIGREEFSGWLRGLVVARVGWPQGRTGTDRDP
jgi:death-on-curing protein